MTAVIILKLYAISLSDGLGYYDYIPYYIPYS